MASSFGHPAVSDRCHDLPSACLVVHAMLSLLTRDHIPGRGWTRRQVLQAGFLGLGSLTLADLLRLRCEAASARPKKDTAIILLWVHGGPSHLETYDLKPDAPAEIRGPFRPMHSNAPGL